MTAAMRDWQGVLRDAAQGKIEKIENVVVPLDGTELSRIALPVARMLSHLYGATLHVVYVGDGPGTARERLQELGLTSEEIRGAVLDNLQGDPAAAILERTRQLGAPMLIMCTHTCGHNEQPLGSVAEAVLAGVPERVILIPADFKPEKWDLRRVLLAHDGTRTSDLAIAPAADLAHRAGAEVTALHVAARTGGAQLEEGSLPAPRYVDQPQHEWPAWAEEFLERMMALGAAPSALHFKLLVTGGQPGSEVAQFARDNGVDLVALAWQGRLEEERGATLKVIVRRAGCPVLLVAPGRAVS